MSIVVDLPAPLGPDQGHHLARGDPQRNAVDRADPAVGLDDAVEQDRWISFR
jgi:hypothetical protein